VTRSALLTVAAILLPADGAKRRHQGSGHPTSECCQPGTFDTCRRPGLVLVDASQRVREKRDG
jgi:hypothetical protein